MEALVALALLVLLAVAAPRWGYDSRPTLTSKEQRLASFGLSWSRRSAAARPRAAPRPIRPARPIDTLAA